MYHWRQLAKPLISRCSSWPVISGRDRLSVKSSRPKLDIFDAKQTRKKGRVGANVTNGAPENAVLERYGRGRFAVPVHSGRGPGSRNPMAVGVPHSPRGLCQTLPSTHGGPSCSGRTTRDLVMLSAASKRRVGDEEGGAALVEAEKLVRRRLSARIAKLPVKAAVSPAALAAFKAQHKAMVAYCAAQPALPPAAPPAAPPIAPSATAPSAAKPRVAVKPSAAPPTQREETASASVKPSAAPPTQQEEKA